jgi:hypothetical protein
MSAAPLPLQKATSLERAAVRLVRVVRQPNETQSVRCNLIVRKRNSI